ncbi:MULTISPECIES: AAA family ATPase [unclassified Massilia]|uniref:AAA family ATPase n=1 Tax=unclassified Massilia TaxID=2609279 RepID=UPI00068EF009|nr:MULTISPECIES: AAA family ATPase [unclassified Massilia]AWG45992.1 hypothetical protein AM586_10425 [Massilia sp. WG5]
MSKSDNRVAPAAHRKSRSFHTNRRYTFRRTQYRGQSCVVKSTQTSPGDAGLIASLRHEYELLHGLDLPGIVTVRALVEESQALEMVMDDAGPENLAARIAAGPLPTAALLDLGCQLALAVSGLHEAGIVHRNINPANIAWDPASGKASLLDFQIAMSLSALAVDSVSPAHLEGNLAYISPEQTGRTGRSVDSRADLYSLGATLYELATGVRPFTAQDPVELVHAQLARIPKPPHGVHPGVPPLVSAIILKLLEKEPERRYLSAQSLLADLQEARRQWTATGALASFALASGDVPRQLSIPEKLYGRMGESALLRQAFDRMGAGQRELVLVTGTPGIGKSALVQQLQHAVIEQRGHFISGKFDQLQSNLPYAGLGEAFRKLVRHLLTEPEAALAAWRARIQEAVAPNGQVLTSVIPEIESILGPQPPLAELGPLEARNRFAQVFTSFLDVFAQSGRPFVFFLDDLQWMDAASLQLVEQWLAGSGADKLLIIGAYRDREVSPAHPLALFLGQLREAKVRLLEIHLDGLDARDVTAMLADALNQEPGHCAELAGLVLGKTAGNPFFIRRLLHSLYHDGLLRFDVQARAWHWDVDDIRRAPVGDNVLELMVQSIGRLPEATRCLLRVAACIGHQFDVGRLAEATGRSRAAAIEALWPALDDGLLLPLRDAYKALRHAGPLDRELAGLPVLMRFVHDRVQQAAYSLLSEEGRQAIHLDIGRRALANIAPGQLDAQLFAVVDQLDFGAALVTDLAERLQLAELNLAAGRKAKASAAYQSAFDYLGVGVRQLPPGAWQDHPALSFALHRELAESAYLSGRHAQAEQLIETALAHAPSSVARADLYSLRVLAATVASDWGGALRWGREGLAVFGHAWPLEGLPEANEAEAQAVMRNVGARRFEDLVGQPEVDDEETRAAMRLLSLLGPPAYFSGSEVLTFLVTRSTNLSLLHGPSLFSAYAYVFYGAIHNARTGEYDVGHAFGKLALALAQRFGNRAEESRTLEVFGLVVQVWRERLHHSLPLMREGHRAGVESGELAYAAFNLCGILINGLPAGVPLASLLADSAVAIDFAARHQNRTAIEIALPFRQFARALTGMTAGAGSFDDADFDEARFLEDAAGNQTAIGQLHVARLQAAFLFGDLDAARRNARQGAACLQSGILGMVSSAEHSFYSALTLAAIYAAAPQEEHGALLGEIRSLHAQLAAWARHCPENFLHKQRLVEAELERLAGSPWQAMTLYGEAVEGAQRSGFVQDAALANELAHRLFLAHGQARVAAVYLQAALASYRQWGATAKLRALEETHAGLPGKQAQASLPEPRTAFALDALGLIKASQAIAAETVLERLFERILQIVVEVAGAQKGMLLLGEPAALRLRARTDAEGSASVLEDLPLADCAMLPRAIIRYVARMQVPLVLDDATARGQFADDPEVKRLGLRSVLCVPLRMQVRVVGLLYLENHAMAGAFAAARVDVVQALAAQAAISLENSTLLAARVRAEAAARFLASAGAALAESLDYGKTLARVVALAVPAFADWCVLDLVRSDGRAVRAEIAFADPADAALAEALKRFTAADGHGGHPPTQVLGSGQAVLLASISDGQRRGMAQDDEHGRLIGQLAPRSMMAVPLAARGRMLGVLTFILTRANRQYDQAELAVARQLADRCALAIDNAGLYEAAQNAIQVREDFLAVASHELKTPLTPLQLQIHLIERRLPKLIENPESAAWLLKSLATLQRQGKRLDRLVNELLDISRIAGGQLTLAPEPVDLAEIARHVVERLEESGELAQSGSRLSLQCGEGITGYWDRLRLEQVLTNLVSNAIKYGEGRPVALLVRVDAAEAVVEVSDRGLGIEPEHLQRIFGRFERAVSARQYGGLGLGLYIASQIVAAMGGSIGVASTLGEGSTFTVRLPLPV